MYFKCNSTSAGCEFFQVYIITSCAVAIALKSQSDSLSVKTAVSIPSAELVHLKISDIGGQCFM